MFYSKCLYFPVSRSFLTLHPPVVFFLSDSSALDSQVLSHCLLWTTWRLVRFPCMCMCLCALLHLPLCLSICAGVCLCVYLSLNYWYDICVYCLPVKCYESDYVCGLKVTACDCKVAAYDLDGCIVILLSFCVVYHFLQNMICVSYLTIWSEWRECYTTGKSGLKHWERQNSQSWVHKLHWCGIMRSFACGTSLPSLCTVLLFSFLCPKLTLMCTGYVQVLVLYLVFILLLCA